ncbi:hypothetical protein FANTH_4968 [Fusarium anthophilum]|uniref:Uncharacterized protein n=1 Tax=Fusarium anthophilum TaxID=48485 RepID=A0A8H4ZPI8_9HYPO|nr:hypothetical protein FANTH_4968 [Fusarium anthophilum]
MDQKAKALVLSINEGKADIHGIGVDVCKDVPVNDITPISMYQFCEAIAADIFHRVGIQKHEAPECFSAMTERIHKGGLLDDSTLERYKGMTFLKHTLLTFRTIQQRTDKPFCLPAGAMGSIIAAVAYRKLRPATDGFRRQNEDFFKVFGELNVVQWLPVAIQVWYKVKGRTFAIELDQNCHKPVATLRKVDGQSLWVILTRMPDMNTYEDIFRKTFSPATSVSGPAVPKLEPSDDPIASIEPNDTYNEPIPLSDDDEAEENTLTLRDYTRQMKALGKRLATPDRAIARRARREIMKKPDQSGQQEDGELGPPKEYFDCYTHFKDLWETCLKNRVSIPNSLRVLIDHHCTPSQVFHLMELEKEHLAETGMEVDG